MASPEDSVDRVGSAVSFDDLGQSKEYNPTPASLDIVELEFSPAKSSTGIEL